MEGTCMQKLKILVGAFVVGFIIFAGNHKVYAAEQDVSSVNENTVTSCENEFMSKISDYLEFVIESEDDEIVAYSNNMYSKTHTYNLVNNSTGEAARWYMTIYYSYSDGSYVEIESVEVEYEVVSGPVVIWRTYFPDDSIFINQYMSSASVSAYYDVTLAASDRICYIVLYAEVDYWGDFVFSMYER